jgi:hypothetical protein
MPVGRGWQHPAQHLFEPLVDGALFLEDGLDILRNGELMRGNVDQHPQDGIAIEGFHLGPPHRLRVVLGLIP